MTVKYALALLKSKYFIYSTFRLIYMQIRCYRLISMQIKPCVIRVYIYLSKPTAWLV